MTTRFEVEWLCAVFHKVLLSVMFRVSDVPRYHGEDVLEPLALVLLESTK